MEILKEQYLPEPKGVKRVLLLLFNIIIFSGLFVLIIFGVGGDLLENYARVKSQSSYLSVSKWSLPAMIGVFMVPSLLYVFVLRLCRRLTQRGLDFAMKFLITVGVIFFLSRIIYGFFLTSYLENKGYSYCYYYSSSSMMGNSTWLKNPEFCMERIAANRRDIEAWFDKRDAKGEPLTLEAVQQGMLALDKAERERYPGFYN